MNCLNANILKGDNVELQLVISSLRDVVRKQADELQAAKAEVTELKQKQQGVPKASGPSVDELQKKLAALQTERETEVRSYCPSCSPPS